MSCFGRKKKRIEDKRPKKLKIKSSESLTENLKDYYRDSPERKHKILIVHRNQFFKDDEEIDYYQTSEAKIKPSELM